MRLQLHLFHLNKSQTRFSYHRRLINSLAQTTCLPQKPNLLIYQDQQMLLCEAAHLSPFSLLFSAHFLQYLTALPIMSCHLDYEKLMQNFVLMENILFKIVQLIDFMSMNLFIIRHYILKNFPR